MLNESFADLMSFRNAINGTSGSMVETINGAMMIITYHLVEAFSNVWAVGFRPPHPENRELENSPSSPLWEHS